MIFLAPLALPWLTAVGVVAFDGRRRAVAGVAALALLLVLALDVVLLFETARGVVYEDVSGRWPQGVGIRVYVDAASALFATVSAFILFALLVHEALEGIRSRAFPGLVLFLCVGLHGVFFTGDAFNFYVFFEVSMVSAFALASYGHGRAELRATWIFVVVNLLGSVLLLAGVTALYHVSGTLDLEGLALRAEQQGEIMPLLVPAALVLSAFSLKLGLFPFHYWVPPVYRDTRPAVAALFAGALATIGSYGLLRIGFGVFGPELESARGLLVVLGVGSALYGSVLSFHRKVAAETFAYVSIAHAGLLMTAIGVGGVHGIEAALWLMLAGALDKSLLFLSLDVPGGKGRLLSGIGATSASGIPLTVGFIGKLALLDAAVASGALLVAVLVVVATAFSIGGLFRSFWQTPEPEPRSGGHGPRATFVFVLALAVLLFGAAPLLLRVSVHAAALALGGAP